MLRCGSAARVAADDHTGPSLLQPLAVTAVRSWRLQVRVLEHIGDACVRKLHHLPNLMRSCKHIALPASIPGGIVETVAHMDALSAAVKHDRVAESHIFFKALKLNDVRPRLPPSPPPRGTFPAMQTPLSPNQSRGSAHRG